MNFEEIRASGCGDEPLEDRAVDPELEKALASWRASDLHESEAALAGLGECPSPAEVLALEAGEIYAPWRRNALARHLIACRRCAARQLATLAGGAVPIPTPSAGAMRRRVQFVAAAAVLASIAASMWALRPDGAGFAGGDTLAVTWVDAQGLKMRGADEPTPDGRVLARAPRAGYLSLVRIGAGDVSSPVVEPVEGSAFQVFVAANEEVVLPLDRPLSIVRGAAYLILFTEEPIPAVELPIRAVDALRGVPPPGGVATSLIAN